MPDKNVQKDFNEQPETRLKPDKKKDKLQQLVDEIKDIYGISVEPVKNNKYKTERIIEHIQSKYDFRFNVVTRELEYRMKDDKAFKYFETRDFNSILTEVKLANHMIGKDSLKSLIESRQISEEYDPFREYIFSLPKWDGQTDHIEKFLQQIYLHNEEERKTLIETFKKWFVAMIGSVLEDRIVNQQCFVLVGRQGIFKTTFLNNLVPKNLQLDYLFSSKFNFENKDHFKYLGMKMLINLDELATLSRTDENVLKTILTDDRVIVRLPYGAYDSKMWRKASFCGSTNNKEFLKDETGNRRFLIFEIDNIALDEFNLDLLYAQAFALFNSNFKYWFDRDNIIGIEDRNESFHDVSIEEDLILEYMEPPNDMELKNDMGFKYETATAINIYLAAKSNRINVNESTKRRIGMVLRKRGFVQKSKKLNRNPKPSKVWLVKFIETKTVESSNGEQLNEDLI